LCQNPAPAFASPFASFRIKGGRDTGCKKLDGSIFGSTLNTWKPRCNRREIPAEIYYNLCVGPFLVRK
jgi:hypothetical protein